MKVLYFDCFSGAAGDMILGALIDAGVPFDDVRHALGSLAIDRDAVWTERVVRAGVTATKFCVRGEDIPGAASGGTAAVGGERPHSHAHAHAHAPAHTHGHDHDHGHEHLHPHVHGPGGETAHGHRSLDDIYRLIDGSALSAVARDRAKALFARLGEAEAAVHGVPLARVHLHEVGALDSIIDIVGTVHAIESLGVAQVVASPLNVGSGMVRSAHGLFPVPAPATLRLLAGVPIYAGAQQAEMVTPTGALLVTGYAGRYGPVPAMRLSRTGYGAGSRDIRETPNVLRVLLGEAEVSQTGHQVTVVEAEIDDMNPQLFGVVMERLLAEGALDVFYTAIQMKKNRPGTLLTVIVPPDARDRLVATIFRETTTIGVRVRDSLRQCLDRAFVSVETPMGAVRVKVARDGTRVLNAAPEFDDCVRLATAGGHPVKAVQAAAMKAYLDGRDAPQGAEPGAV